MRTVIFGEKPESQSDQSDFGSKKGTDHVINVYSGTAIGASCAHARPAECTSPCIGFHWICVIHWMSDFRFGCGLRTRRTKGCVQPIRPETCDCHGCDLNLLGMVASATEFGTYRSSRRVRPCRPSCAPVSATGSGGAAMSGFSAFPPETTEPGPTSQNTVPNLDGDIPSPAAPGSCCNPRHGRFGTGEQTRWVHAGYTPDTRRVWTC